MNYIFWGFFFAILNFYISINTVIIDFYTNICRLHTDVQRFKNPRTIFCAFRKNKNLDDRHGYLYGSCLLNELVRYNRAILQHLRIPWVRSIRRRPLYSVQCCHGHQRYGTYSKSIPKRRHIDLVVEILSGGYCSDICHTTPTRTLSDDHNPFARCRSTFSCIIYHVRAKRLIRRKFFRALRSQIGDTYELYLLGILFLSSSILTLHRATRSSGSSQLSSVISYC